MNLANALLDLCSHCVFHYYTEYFKTWQCYTLGYIICMVEWVTNQCHQVISAHIWVTGCIWHICLLTCVISTQKTDEFIAIWILLSTHSDKIIMTIFFPHETLGMYLLSNICSYCKQKFLLLIIHLLFN